MQARASTGEEINAKDVAPPMVAEKVRTWLDGSNRSGTIKPLGEDPYPRGIHIAPFRPCLPAAIALIDEAVTFRRVQMEPDPIDQLLGAARIARPQIFSVSAAPISRFSAI